jgi:amino acid permease
MFDSLDDQLKKVEQHESTTKERILRYLAIAAVSVLIFGGIIIAVQKFQ